MNFDYTDQFISHLNQLFLTFKFTVHLFIEIAYNTTYHCYQIPVIMVTSSHGYQFPWLPVIVVISYHGYELQWLPVTMCPCSYPGYQLP